jgi:hypothetical protein
MFSPFPTTQRLLLQISLLYQLHCFVAFDSLDFVDVPVEAVDNRVWFGARAIAHSIFPTVISSSVQPSFVSTRRAQEIRGD